jgi:hypothetical protein
MTQIIEISTQYQLANVAALIRSGRLGGDGNLGEAGRLGDDRQRRIPSSWRTIPSPPNSPRPPMPCPGRRGLLADFDLDCRLECHDLAEPSEGLRHLR